LLVVKEMAVGDPADAQLLPNEAVALIKVGDVEDASGRMASALSNYREALKIREQLSAAANADVVLRRELAEARLKIQMVRKGSTQTWYV
jgi:ssDNA-binding replication factor A large subunit